jgi:hypothetical protein
MTKTLKQQATHRNTLNKKEPKLSNTNVYFLDITKLNDHFGEYVKTVVTMR